MGGLTELGVIERIKARTAGVPGGGPSRAVRLGMGDDCAILAAPAGQELVVTTDFSLEGRHFRRDWHTAASVGHRALARGLSDLAAMGAKPMAAFLSLALPRSAAKDAKWLNGFLDGWMGLAEEFGVPLAGGDTSEAPGDEVLVDVMLLGSAPKGRALRRSGAKVGDGIYCTGALGGAAAELAALMAAPKRFARTKADGGHPHLFPEPRLAVGQALLKRRVATSCMDLSDGLSTDLNHLVVASGVAAEVELAALPAHSLTVGMGEAEQINAVLHGGEDYELLFTVSAKTKVPGVIAGVPVTRIGTVVSLRKAKGQRVTLVSEGERFGLEPRGWEHLK